MGTRLRTQRLAQTLAKHDLAHMAGLSVGALHKLEQDGQCSLETPVRVVHALGLVDEFEDLFALKRQSIAQMVQAALAVHQRQRAPRRKVS